MKPLCHRWRQLMLADLDQELDAAGRIRLERHLEACAECSAQHRHMKAAREATAALRIERRDVQVPEGLAALVMQQVRQEMPESARLRAKGPGARTIGNDSVWQLPDISHLRRPGTARRYATALATVVLVVALAIVYRSVSQTTDSRRGSAASAGTTVVARQQAQEKELGADSAGPVTDAAGASNPVSKANGYSANAAPEANSQVNDSRTAGKGALTTSAAAPYSGSGSAGAGSTAMGSAGPGYRLYTGNLTDLGTLIAEVPGFRLQPQLLSDAANLRILVSPADAAQPVRQVVVLAGYPAGDTARYAEQYRTSLPAGSSRVTVETIVPESQQRLAAIFGDALLASLLPTASERQLTYIMITIGG